MRNPPKRTWLQDGWNWIDRAFFFPATVLVTAAVVGHLLWGLGPADWGAEEWSAAASWIQAIGSIAAIIFGFVIVRFQLSEQRREAAQQAEAQAKSQRARGFQIFMGRLALASKRAKRMDEAMQRPSPNWDAMLQDCNWLEQIMTSPADPAFTPAIAVAIQTLHGQTVTVKRVVELCSRQDQPISEAYLTTARKGPAHLKKQFEMACDWVSAELDLALSEEDREQIRRAAKSVTFAVDAKD